MAYNLISQHNNYETKYRLNSIKLHLDSYDIIGIKYSRRSIIAKLN